MSKKSLQRMLTKNAQKNLTKELTTEIVYKNASLCYSFLNLLGSNISKLSNGRCGQVVVTPSSEDLQKSCLAKGGHHMLLNF